MILAGKYHLGKYFAKSSLTLSVKSINALQFTEKLYPYTSGWIITEHICELLLDSRRGQSRNSCFCPAIDFFRTSTLLFLNSQNFKTKVAGERETGGNGTRYGGHANGKKGTHVKSLNDFLFLYLKQSIKIKQ